MISETEMREAWDHIARTPDGKFAYLYLQRFLMGVSASSDTLQTDHGQRIFAAQLIGLMAKGIQESGGSSDSVLTFAVAGPRPVANPRGAARRVTVDSYVPGYSDPDPTPGG
jgi:hypothetical protein